MLTLLITKTFTFNSKIHPLTYRYYRTESSTSGTKNKNTKDFTEIPVINVAPFFDGTNQDLVVKKVDDACRNVGFFYIKGHGVRQELMENVINLTQQFFTLPLEEKNKISITNSKYYRGYQKLGQNITLGKRDWHEAIDFFSEDDIPLEGKCNPERPIHGPNQWPSVPQHFRPTFEIYIQEMKKLGANLMKIFAVTLGQDINYFEKFTNNSFWILRVIGYPPMPKNLNHDIGISTGAHTDYGCLTMVNQANSIFGLQVQNAAGEWITADPIPGAFVINIGDMLSHWTGGQYKSTLHRVINNTSQITRISIPFFFEPNYDAKIRPLGSEGSSSKEIVYGHHLVNKVTNNFDFKVV